MKTLVRSVSLGLFVLAVDGCLPGQDQGKTLCRTIRIESTYVGQAWANAGASFFDPVTMSIPGVLRVVGAQQGLTALVTFTTSNGDIQCNYQQANPGSLRLSQCSSGLGGASVSTRDVRLHVEGAGAVGSSVVVADFAEAQVCATAAWLQTNPHFTRHEPGVDDDVTFVGDIEKYVMSSRGVVEHLQSFRAREHRELSRRFGALEPQAARHLAGRPMGSSIAVAVTFNLDVDWSALTTGLASTVDGERFAAQALLRSAVATARPNMLSLLTSLGASQITFSSDEPMAFAEMDTTGIWSLARSPAVSLVRVDVHHPGTWLAVPSNGTSHARIDTAFNDRVMYGAGLRIGTDELGSSSRCGMFAKHDAFGFGPIVNKTLPDSPIGRECTSDVDCQFRCGDETKDPAVAFCSDTDTSAGRRCTNGHINATASLVLGARAGSPFSAAAAAFYNYNEYHGCSDAGFNLAFDWFSTNGVRTVYESIGCNHVVGVPTIQDLYGRDYNTTVFRAAGNDTSTVACPETANALCVGGVTASDTMWVSKTVPSVGSSYLNPSSDREEPDIVSLSENVLSGLPKKDSTSTSYYRPVSGTSIATPTAAAASLLLRQACGRPEFDQRQMRAIMMASAWSRNADGWRYSTPGVVDPLGGIRDHKDGSGILDANNLIAFCMNGGTRPAVTSGTLTVDLWGTPRLPPLPRLVPASAPPGDPGGGPPSGSGDARAKSPPSDRLNGVPYWTARLPAGARVRTTFSWDTCPARAFGRIATDFDVLLCSETKCIFASRSFDDNNEGLDVNVDAEGQWTLWAVFPAPIDAGIYTLAYGCRGSAVEPTAFAVAWGSF